MNSARTDRSSRCTAVIELVTDTAVLPDALKTVFQRSGIRLAGVHRCRKHGSALQLKSKQPVLVLMQDDLPDAVMEQLLSLQQPVWFVDWDGESVQPVVKTLIHKLQPQPSVEQTVTVSEDPVSADYNETAMPTTWLLAASIGGPEAMRNFLSRLPGDLPACLILAQHIGREFQNQLVQQLDQASPLPVRLMAEGMRHAPQQVLVVPSDQQIRLDDEGRFRLKPGKHRFTPCIDQVVSGLLPQLGNELGMIVFSGMSSDGVAGSHAVHVAGGPVWVQTPETCVVASMVEGTMRKTETGLAGSPDELADMLVSVYH